MVNSPLDNAGGVRGVQSLGWKDSLDKVMAPHSSILAWRIPRTESLVGYSPQGRKSPTQLSD